MKNLSALLVLPLLFSCVAPEDTAPIDCDEPEPEGVACDKIDVPAPGYSDPYLAWMGQVWDPERATDADAVAVHIGPLACARRFNAVVFYAWMPEYSEEALDNMPGPIAVSLWSEGGHTPALYPLPHNVESFAVPSRLTVRAYVAPNIVRVVVPIETTIGPGDVFVAVYPPPGLSLVATTEPPPETCAFRLDDAMSWQPLNADMGIGLYVVPPGTTDGE